MDEDTKLSGANPEAEGTKTAGAGENQDKGATSSGGGIPQGRFDEIYAKWKTAEEEKQASSDEADRLRQENVYYRNLASNPTESVPATQPQADVSWNEKWEQDPEQAGKELARKEAQAVYQKQRQQEQFMNLKQSSVDKVKARHPDLFNSDGSVNRQSPKFKMYDQVARENPEYINLRKGPELAMREMEDRIASQVKADEGDKIQQAKREGALEENQRSASASASYTTSSTAPKDEVKEVSLSDNEKRIASKLGMSATDYASAKGKTRI